MLIIGCDEAGRGALAGPIVAAAIILGPQAGKQIPHWYVDIKDSKQLSPVKRFTLEPLLRRYALAWGIGAVSSAVIDRINIHQANLLAMRRAVASVQQKLSHATYGKLCVLVDGRFTIPNLDIAQEAVVHGDSTVFAISAASILAKTYRDRLMTRLAKQFPQYGFDRHKGYGTANHLESLRQHGVSTAHRQSFCHID